MRKNNAIIAANFKTCDRASVGSKMTDGNAVYLHGNKIMWWEDMGETLKVTCCGWNTPTTRNTINEILHYLGIRCGFFQKNYRLYFDVNSGERALSVEDDQVIQVKPIVKCI